jgi:nucleoside-diphosphate-sugar epimerase
MTNDSAPVLVTGASGFLGGRLAEMLAAQGQTVRVLARHTADLSHLSQLQLQVVRGDLNDAAALAEAVRGARVIYHCAACSTDWAANQTYHAGNVLGTQSLLTAATAEPKLQRFLHVSTTDVYGYPQAVCDEDGALRDRGLPYNRTKIQGEQAVWQAHRERGLPVTIVRPSTIYGPRGKAFVTDFEELLRQRLMLLVDGGRSRGGFTYVDNTAQAMIDAAAHPATLGRAYNLSDGTDISWRGYTTALAEALGYRRPWLQLGFPAAMAAAYAMEAPFRVLPLPGRPLLTRHAMYLLGRDQEFPAARARQEFGFEPQVTFEEGIARSVAWLQKQRA